MDFRALRRAGAPRRHRAVAGGNQAPVLPKRAATERVQKGCLQAPAFWVDHPAGWGHFGDSATGTGPAEEEQRQTGEQAGTEEETETDRQTATEEAEKKGEKPEADEDQAKTAARAATEAAVEMYRRDGLDFGDVPEEVQPVPEEVTPTEGPNLIPAECGQTQQLRTWGFVWTRAQTRPTTGRRSARYGPTWRVAMWQFYGSWWPTISMCWKSSDECPKDDIHRYTPRIPKSPLVQAITNFPNCGHRIISNLNDHY